MEIVKLDLSIEATPCERCSVPNGEDEPEGPFAEYRLDFDEDRPSEFVCGECFVNLGATR